MRTRTVYSLIPRIGRVKNGTGIPRWNGDGSCVEWKNDNYTPKRGYKFTYDSNSNPSRIYFTNGSMTKYVYSATGQKLSVDHYVSMPNVTWAFGVQPDAAAQSQAIFAGHTDYLLGGRLLVKEGIIKRLLFEGGYLDATALSQTTYGFTPYYYNQDHLGNNREVVNASGTVQQVTNYYPFGTPYADPSAVKGASLQPYKYNGKELDRMHGLDTYDYGARQYDPVLARWDRVDPLCEKYYSVSPYAYCTNNPIKFIDNDGKIIRDSKGQIVYASSGETVLVQHEPGYRAILEKGYIFSDNGQPIEVLNNNGGADRCWDTNSHGYTFAEGKYWINGDQVEHILKGDNYRNITLNHAKSGDVIVYSENKDIAHSVTIVNSNGTNNGTTVNGLGGLETEAHNEKLLEGWRSNGNVQFRVYHKEQADRLASEKDITELKKGIPKYEDNEKQ